MAHIRICIFGLVVGVATAGCSAPPVGPGTPGATGSSPTTDATEATAPDPTPVPTPSGPPSRYLGGAAWSTKVAGGGAWIQVDPPVDQVVKVDSLTGEPTVKIDAGRSIGTDGSEVWVARGPAGLVKVDPNTGEELLAVQGGGSYAAVGGGSVWSLHDGGIGRWNTTTGELLAVIAIDVAEVTELLFAHGALWVTAKEDGLVLRIDPATNAVVATIESGPGAHGLAADENGLWVTNYRANSVSRIDPGTNEVVATIEGVGSGVGIAAGGGATWVSTQGEGISRIDPATNEAELVVDLPFEWNYGVAYDDGVLWISSVEKKLVYRVGLADL